MTELVRCVRSCDTQVRGSGHRAVGHQQARYVCIVCSARRARVVSHFEQTNEAARIARAGTEPTVPNDATHYRNAGTVGELISKPLEQTDKSIFISHNVSRMSLYFVQARVSATPWRCSFHPLANDNHPPMLSTKTSHFYPVCTILQNLPLE